jgi:hypothetical protein
MKIAFAATLVTAAGLASASPALATRACEPLEIECHKTCTIPNIKNPAPC